MNTSPVVILTSIAALFSAAAGGMMYVFSTFVMRGLDRTGAVDAITAMRGINVEANSNPVFLLGYFGATILALAVGVIAAIQLRQPGSWVVLVGASAKVTTRSRLRTMLRVSCDSACDNFVSARLLSPPTIPA